MKPTKHSARRATLRSPWWPICLLTLTASGLFGPGCEEPENHVVVEVSTAGFAPASELDELEVTVTASRTVAGDAVCEPYSETFEVGYGAVNPIRFPLTIEVKPGATYDKILFVRVVGRLWGSVRLKAERMVSLEGGDVRLPVLLSADCMGVGTGDGQHCMGGLALNSPYAAIFDDGMYVDPNEPCVEP